MLLLGRRIKIILNKERSSSSSIAAAEKEEFYSATDAGKDKCCFATITTKEEEKEKAPSRSPKKEIITTPITWQRSDRTNTLLLLLSRTRNVDLPLIISMRNLSLQSSPSRRRKGDPKPP